MKPTMLIFFFLLSLSSAAFARIGETPAECIARYGEPTNIDKEKNQILFQKGSMFIMASFYEGLCDMIVLRKLEQDILGNAEKLTETEIDVLLEANGGGTAWKKTPVLSMDERWATEDGALLANYGAINNVLAIVTREWSARTTAEQNAEQKSKLDGF